MSSVSKLTELEFSRGKALGSYLILKQEGKKMTVKTHSQAERSANRKQLNDLENEYHSANKDFKFALGVSCPSIFAEFVVQDIRRIIKVSVMIQAYEKMPRHLKKQFDFVWGELLMDMAKSDAILLGNTASPLRDILLKIITIYKAIVNSRPLPTPEIEGEDDSLWAL